MNLIGLSFYFWKVSYIAQTNLKDKLKIKGQISILLISIYTILYFKVLDSVGILSTVRDGGFFVLIRTILGL